MSTEPAPALAPTPKEVIEEARRAAATGGDAPSTADEAARAEARSREIHKPLIPGQDGVVSIEFPVKVSPLPEVDSRDGKLH